MPSTVTLPAEARPRRKRGTKGLSWILWALVAALAGLFFVNDAVPFFHVTPEVYGPFWPRRGALLLHVAGGSVALLAGVFQFWTRLRARFLRLHRWGGRLYLGGIAVASTTALYLAAHSTVSWTFGVALFVAAAIWLLSTLFAYVAIRNGQVRTHREWMVRSYILTFVFVLTRLLVDGGVFPDVGTIEERLTAVAWLSWTVPLFVTEIVFQWNRMVTPVRVARP
jgi:uncharacterized membrane protein